MEKKLFGINYVEIDDENVTSLMQEVQMPSFGYDKKMIVAKNLNLFKKDTKKRGNSVKEIRDNLEKYLKNNAEYVNENLVLVFVEDTIEKLNITKTVESIGGAICEFKEQKPFELEKRLTALCNAYKVKAENGAIRYLIEISGTQMQELINEIRKLIEYVRRRSVRLQKKKSIY